MHCYTFYNMWTAILAELNKKNEKKDKKDKKDNKNPITLEHLYNILHNHLTPIELSIIAYLEVSQSIDDEHRLGLASLMLERAGGQEDNYDPEHLLFVQLKELLHDYGLQFAILCNWFENLATDQTGFCPMADLLRNGQYPMTMEDMLRSYCKFPSMLIGSVQLYVPVILDVQLSTVDRATRGYVLRALEYDGRANALNGGLHDPESFHQIIDETYWSAQRHLKDARSRIPYCKSVDQFRGLQTYVSTVRGIERNTKLFAQQQELLELISSRLYALGCC